MTPGHVGVFPPFLFLFLLISLHRLLSTYGDSAGSSCRTGRQLLDQRPWRPSCASLGRAVHLHLVCDGDLSRGDSGLEVCATLRPGADKLGASRGRPLVSPATPSGETGECNRAGGEGGGWRVEGGGWDGPAGACPARGATGHWPWARRRTHWKLCYVWRCMGCPASWTHALGTKPSTGWHVSQGARACETGAGQSNGSTGGPGPRRGDESAKPKGAPGRPCIARHRRACGG